MLRNLVKFTSTSIPEIKSSYFILRNKTNNFLKLNIPSVCSYQQHKCICFGPTRNNTLRTSLSSYNVIKDYVRFKSKDQKSRNIQDDSDDEDEDENEDGNQYDEDGNLMRHQRVKSIRIDSLLLKVMGLTRRKVDSLFLEAKFRHNGQRLSKKSLEVKEGDILEICTDPVDTGGTTEMVSKLTILKIKPLQDLASFDITFTIDKRK